MFSFERFSSSAETNCSPQSSEFLQSHGNYRRSFFGCCPGIDHESSGIAIEIQRRVNRIHETPLLTNILKETGTHPAPQNVAQNVDGKTVAAK